VGAVTRNRGAADSGSARRRLDVDERREELLRVGMALFSTRAYDEIWVEEIAEEAGISRACSTTISDQARLLRGRDPSGGPPRRDN